jgi:hypothetical protein
MLRNLSRLYKGLRWSETYGSHPGTWPLLICLLIGGVAGGWWGLVIMGLWLVPVYLYGAWERGN